MFPHPFALALFLGQILTYVYAIPMPASQIIRDIHAAQWTARDLHWTCSKDGSSCTYGLTITENIISDDSSDSSTCSFTFQAPSDETAVKSSFSNLACDDAPQYHCSGSWGSNGFLVLTVENIQESRRAYFGYNDDEISNGQISFPHHSLAYIINLDAVPDYEIQTEEVPQDSEASQDDAAVSSDVFVSQAATDDDSEDQDDGKVDVQADASIDMAVGEEPEEQEDSNDPEFYSTVEESSDDDYVANTTDPVIVEGGNDDGDDSTDPTTQLVDETADESDDESDGEPAADLVNACPGTFAAAPIDDDDSADDDDTIDSPDDSPDVTTVPAAAETWAIKNITRYLQYEPNSIQMEFLIDVLPSGPTDIPCNILVDLDDSKEPELSSWAVESCRSSGWYFSWGYNVITNSAVATLINPEKSEEAWFGWNAINADFPAVTLADAGPSVVQTCDC